MQNKLLDEIINVIGYTLYTDPYSILFFQSALDSYFVIDGEKKRKIEEYDHHIMVHALHKIQISDTKKEAIAWFTSRNGDTWILYHFQIPYTKWDQEIAYTIPIDTITLREVAETTVLKCKECRPLFFSELFLHFQAFDWIQLSEGDEERAIFTELPDISYSAQFLNITIEHSQDELKVFGDIKDKGINLKHYELATVKLDGSEGYYRYAMSYLLFRNYFMNINSKYSRIKALAPFLKPPITITYMDAMEEFSEDIVL